MLGPQQDNEKHTKLPDNDTNTSHLEPKVGIWVCRLRGELLKGTY